MLGGKEFRRFVAIYFQSSIAQPRRYLECECCKVGATDKERILATYPDVSIAYKLHLECPRYINLYDWLQAFVQVVLTETAGLIMHDNSN